MTRPPQGSSPPLLHRLGRDHVDVAAEDQGPLPRIAGPQADYVGPPGKGKLAVDKGRVLLDLGLVGLQEPDLQPGPPVLPGHELLGRLLVAHHAGDADQVAGQAEQVVFQLFNRALDRGDGFLVHGFISQADYGAVVPLGRGPEEAPARPAFAAFFLSPKVSWRASRQRWHLLT